MYQIKKKFIDISNFENVLFHKIFIEISDLHDIRTYYIRNMHFYECTTFYINLNETCDIWCQNTPLNDEFAISLF